MTEQSKIESQYGAMLKYPKSKMLSGFVQPAARGSEVFKSIGFSLSIKGRINLGLSRFGCDDLVKCVNRRIFFLVVVGSILVPLQLAEAGQAKVHRVGVILQGGVIYAAVDGLREGLKELRFEEKKDFLLEIRDAGGDLKIVEEAAKNLEREKVNLIFAINTSVARVTQTATVEVPIVFCAGTDPVALGLVDSFAKPGGRLTGVHFLATNLTAKRLEIIKDIQPKLRRVMTFYNPANPIAAESAKLGRVEARRLHVDFIERHVGSVKELEAALRMLRAGEADAYFFTADAMMASQAHMIIEAARDKRWPTMFDEGYSVAKGGLANYGISYHEAGRLSAKYIHRILTGINPKDLPVETLHKLRVRTQPAHRT